ncbi:MAG TPA: transporter [Polyangiaceae bacterium]|nr:transporter [Polyangiaceae bacterium]
MSTALAFLIAVAAPATELRDLSTDRPDITESARSVDAGHFQAEIDAARLVRDEGQSSYSLLGSNLKFGLTSFWDVQLVLEPVVAASDGDVGPGDVTLRTKFNLFGNDGDTALALMPWIKAPTAGSRGNGAWEGGLIAPLGFELPLEFSGGLMLELDRMGNESGDGHHFEMLTSATLGHALVGDLSTFVELAGTASAEAGSDYVLVCDAGPVWLVTPTLQLDGGVGLGLTDAAEDLFVFSGISFKF